MSYRKLNFNDGFNNDINFDDLNADQVEVTPIGNLNSDNVQDALDEHQGDIDELVALSGSSGPNLGTFDGSVITDNNTIKGALQEIETSLEAHEALTNNPHSTTKAQIGLGNVLNTLHNFSATTDPTGTDDTNAGYSKGSIWINTVTNETFMCTDETASSAVWGNNEIKLEQIIEETAGENITAGQVVGYDEALDLIKASYKPTARYSLDNSTQLVLWTTDGSGNITIAPDLVGMNALSCEGSGVLLYSCYEGGISEDNFFFLMDRSSLGDEPFFQMAGKRFGSSIPAGYNNSYKQFLQCVYVGSAQVVALHTLDTDPNYLYVSILDVSGRAITLNTPQKLDTNTAVSGCLAYHEIEDKVLFFYQRTIGGSIYVVEGTVGATSMTFGTPFLMDLSKGHFTAETSGTKEYGMQAHYADNSIVLMYKPFATTGRDEDNKWYFSMWYKRFGAWTEHSASIGHTTFEQGSPYLSYDERKDRWVFVLTDVGSTYNDANYLYSRSIFVYEKVDVGSGYFQLQVESKAHGVDLPGRYINFQTNRMPFDGNLSSGSCVWWFSTSNTLIECDIVIDTTNNEVSNTYTIHRGFLNSGEDLYQTQGPRLAAQDVFFRARRYFQTGSDVWFSLKSNNTAGTAAPSSFNLRQVSTQDVVDQRLFKIKPAAIALETVTTGNTFKAMLLTGIPRINHGFAAGTLLYVDDEGNLTDKPTVYEKYDKDINNKRPIGIALSTNEISTYGISNLESDNEF